MAFTSLDQVVAALPGQLRSISKPSTTAKGAGTYADLFMVAGIPAGAATPAVFGSAGTAYTAGGSVLGAIPWANPGVGEAALARMAFSGSVAGTLILYDRLWACSGMSGTVSTNQSIVSFPGLPTRAGLGDYVEPWLEWYSATGATAATVALTYTDSAGVTGQVTPAISNQASPTTYQMLPLPLAAGSVGVRAPTNVKLSGTTGTAGNFGLTLLKRIAEVPIYVTNVNSPIDLFGLGLPKIPNDSCLCLMFLSSTTSTGVVGGNLSLIAG